MILVFIQGILSFFSPCVLPLIPLYIGYLSGGGTARDAAGNLVYNRKKTMLHTIFFVIGISFAFFVLGLGMSAVGMLFRTNQMLFARLGGILVIFFGLYQLGVFSRQHALETERHLPIPVEKMTMSPVTALLMGFVFSFAWTPCVGPTLASVLLLAASAASRQTGMLLIGLYTLGFILPFLVVGLFAASLLIVLQKHRGIVNYTVKIGGVLMILIGVMMLTGIMNTITGYLSRFSGADSGPAVTVEAASAEKAEAEEPDAEEAAGSANTASADKVYPAPALDLYDQYGHRHTLEEYRGKVIFLNFWATWCPPCREEMPDIQKLYESFGEEEDPEVVILGVAFPGYNGEGDEEEIAAFFLENGYTYPTLMDRSYDLMRTYGITAYPTTYMIDREGNLFGYVVGGITGETMRDIIRQTLDGQKEPA